MCRLLVTIFFLQLLLCPVVSNAAQKALLVGINDYSRGDNNDLNGPINDVMVMRQILIEKSFFEEDDIKILLDSNASKAGIKKAFQNWLIDGTQPGDIVLFYFSGHGSQVKDISGDESDGKDEILCPWDVGTGSDGNLLIDDELGLWMDNLIGRNIVLIVDACHSGTISRSINNLEVSKLEPTRMTKSRYMPVYISPSNEATRGISSKKSDIPSNAIILSASQANQTAQELLIADSVYGGFTFGLAATIMRSSNLTYSKLFDGVRNIVKDKLNLAQDPVIMIEEGDVEILEQQIFMFPEPESATSESPETLSDTESQTTGSQGVLPGLSDAQNEKVLIAIGNIEGISNQDSGLLAGEIEKFPFTRIVPESEVFDFILRGEMTSSSYKLRLVGSTGDVWHLNETEKLEDLGLYLSQPLEYAYMAKMFSSLDNPENPFQFQLSISDPTRRDFFFGEELNIKVDSDKDGYLLVLNLDSKGNIHIIYPNAYHHDNKLVAGKALEIPDLEMRNKQFYLEFGPPAGEERILAIATQTDIDFESIGSDTFSKLFEKAQPGPQPIETRADFMRMLTAMIKKKNSEWNSDIAIIRSHSRDQL